MKKVLITMVLAAVAGGPMASGEDEMTSLSYISYLERYATVSPASQDEDLEAVINMPLVAGDRVDTAREARMEVVLADGNTMWLDEYTTLSLDTVAFSRDGEADRTVIFLADGSIIVEVTDFDLSDKPTRIDSRGATIYLDEPGLYRIRALMTGGLRVEVMTGLAEAATSSGGVLVRAETSAEVGGGEVQRTEPALTWDDDFAAWVQMRRQTVAGESSQHVDLRYSRQAAQLDNYGTWIYDDSLSAWAWQPSVAQDWQPYRSGRWYWTPTGWSWISYEPWGWLPYHYGRWHFSASIGWAWSWGGVWGPAWVNWMYWPGYVGWCPSGYYGHWAWSHPGYGYPGYPSNPIYRPPYPGGGGGGHAQPARRNVVPPRDGVDGRVAAEGTQTLRTRNVSPQEQALDLNGRTRVADVDRRGWTAVRDTDFASPNLPRLSRRGDEVMPRDGDQTGIVMSGPLTTRSPAVANTSGEIESVFRQVATRSNVDVSRVMARDNSLSADALQTLARPTSAASLSRRSPESPLLNRQLSNPQPVLRSAAPSTGSQSASPQLTTQGASPFSSSTGSRSAQPNIYRPPRFNTSPGSTLRTPGSTSSRGARPSVAPRSGSGSVSRSRPVVVPPTSSSTLSRSPVGSPRAGAPTVRQPSTSRAGAASKPTTRSSTMGTSPRTKSPSARSRPRSSSPSVRSKPRSSSPSVRSKPRSSSPSVRSSPRSSGSSRSSGGSTRSSSGSSRSSGGGSSKGSSGARPN